MKFKTRPLKWLFFILLTLFSVTGFAQPTWTFSPFGDQKKPEQYEEKKLASEKTGDKKFTKFRRFIQNNTTRYNFYFNADAKLDMVLERASLSQKDDYSRLLSFYPYTLDATAAQGKELDSVIYKATAGILLHDLRSDWVDNMYLLIGKSYYLKKEFDSAALTFQFINYNLFPRKKGEDYDRIVGGNDEANNGALSIANKEKRNVLQKVFSLPPSRNDALVWLTRTYVEQGDYGEAAGLINILQQDKNLPTRLQNDLDQVTAYWFFAQGNYDSAANHLERALSTADNKNDRGRWEYLLAQLQERNENFEEASKYYDKAAQHTSSPILEIYARLSDAKMLRNTGNIKELDNAIARLLKMGRRDKYDGYQDIIYYSAAQLSMQRPDTLNAMGLYGKSTAYALRNAGFRDNAFLNMGNISYAQRNYRAASSFYDSLNLQEPEIADQKANLEERRKILTSLVEKINIIEREDSLQTLAGLSPDARETHIKKILRKYRKENGLKDEDNSSNGANVLRNLNSAQASDLFADNGKGEWYFYNGSMRSRGFGEFKGIWGKRENKDNWRRKNAGTGNFNTIAGVADPGSLIGKGNNDSLTAANAYTYDALMGNIPLTPEKIVASDKLIASAMFSLAQQFQNDLQDYTKAIETYLEYLERFPAGDEIPASFLGLYFCYSKVGNDALAKFYKNKITSDYSATKQAMMLQNPGLLQPNKKNEAVTKRYAGIYNKFVEGDFEAARADKKMADSIYGTNYWSPQLLYIESMYFIQKEQDSMAISKLQNLQTMYPDTDLKEKAATMIDVLGRRKEIVDYLTKLEVTRLPEDVPVIFSDNVVKPKTKVTIRDSAVVKTAEVPKKIQTIKTDSTLKVPEKYVSGSFKIEPNGTHFVAMILDKVDIVYVNEARTALNRFNSTSYETNKLKIEKDTLDNDRKLLLIGSFEDAALALKYFDKVKKAAPVEISWLPVAKYSFIILTENNMEVLKDKKELEALKILLNKNYENRF